MARGFGIGRIQVDLAPAREFRPAVDATRIEKALSGRRRRAAKADRASFPRGSA